MRTDNLTFLTQRHPRLNSGSTAMVDILDEAQRAADTLRHQSLSQSGRSLRRKVALEHLPSKDLSVTLASSILAAQPRSALPSAPESEAAFATLSPKTSYPHPSNDHSILLNTGEETLVPIRISPYRSKAIATFFISYYIHASLAQPFPWSTSHMVRILAESHFRKVGTYILHETQTRLHSNIDSGSLSGVILQGYPQSMLLTLQTEWWLDFEHRLQTGKINFQDVLAHDPYLLVLRADEKLLTRNTSTDPIPRGYPVTIDECFSELRDQIRIPYVGSFLADLQDHGGEPPNTDVNLRKLYQHLSTFRASQKQVLETINRTRELRAQLDNERNSLDGARPIRAHQDDESSERVASLFGPWGTRRDRQISMSNETFFSASSHLSKDTFLSASEGIRSGSSSKSSVLATRHNS
jgi:hypothetical protein